MTELSLVNEFWGQQLTSTIAYNVVCFSEKKITPDNITNDLHYSHKIGILYVRSEWKHYIPLEHHLC